MHKVLRSRGHHSADSLFIMLSVNCIRERDFKETPVHYDSHSKLSGTYQRHKLQFIDKVWQCVRVTQVISSVAP